MSITRTRTLQLVAVALGGRTGTIASGSATSAVLNGLVGTTRDDQAYRGWDLIMPDASAEGDRERLVQGWDDASGTATFDARTTDTSLAGETYILMPPDTYTLIELREAVNAALRHLQRTYRYTLPYTPGQVEVDLSPLSWLTADADVDAVFTSESPSLLHNEDFAQWQNGPSAAPDGWTLGNGAVAQSTMHAIGGLSAQLTRTSVDATLTQALPQALVHYLARIISTPATVTVGAWVQCSAASRARIGVSDGLTTTYSAYHTGGGGLEWLTATKTLTSGATALQAVCSVDTGAASAVFSRVLLVPASSIADGWKQQGSAGARVRRVMAVTRNRGGRPIVEISENLGGVRPLVLYTRRTFAELSADSDTTDCPEATLVARTVVELATVQKPGQDRTRYDRLLTEYRPLAARLERNLIDIPVPDPVRPVIVSGV